MQHFCSTVGANYNATSICRISSEYEMIICVLDVVRTLLFILLLFLVLLWMKRHGNRKTIPGPRYLFGVGPLLSHFRFIFTSVPEAASFYGNKYGDIVRVWIDSADTLIIKSPSLTWRVLKSNKYTSRFGNRTGLMHIGMFDSGIIWNNDVPKWRYLRTFFQKAVNADAMDRACTVAAEETTRQLERLPWIQKRTNDSSVEALDFIRLISFFATNRLMLNVPISDDKAEKIVQEIIHYFKAWEYFLIRPPLLYFGSTYRKHVLAIKEVNQSMQLLIDLKRTSYEKWKEDGNDVTGESDFMTQLLYEKENGEMDDRDVRQCLLEMLLAGTDTSSVTIFYLLVYLAENADIESRVYDEVRNVLGSSDLPPSKSKLDHLVYLEQAIKESLRIKPVGPVSIRLAVNDDKIGDMVIRKGTRIILNYAEMHRRVEVFPNPDVFDPARFDNSYGDISKKDFVPFGSGPKGCVGQYLAMVEMKSIISTLIRRYKVVNANKTTSRMKTNWDIAQQPCEPQYMYFLKRT